MQKKLKKKLFIVLLIFFFLNFLSVIFSYRGEYLSHFDPAYWKERFLRSQWGVRPGCMLTDPHINPATCAWDDGYYQKHKNEKFVPYKENPLGDDGLYTYAGWEYVTGRDPTTLNAEAPPFGKYLIGLSILLFGNQNIFALLSGVFVLCAFYFLNMQVFKDKFFASIPVVLFSFEPLFYTQMRAPFLDLLYLGFLFLTLAFFLRKQFFHVAIFLGLMAATKNSLSTFLLVIGTTLIYLFITKRRKEIKKYLFTLPLAFLVFILTYARFFFDGHSIIEFLKVQKWIVDFYSNGVKGSMFSPLEILSTGTWNTWWGESIHVPEWHLGWVILFFVSLAAGFLIVQKDKYDPVGIFVVWFVVYLLFLSFIPMWPRYLLLLLPFMYNLSVWVLSKNTRRFL